jgi:hypothetical protein
MDPDSIGFRIRTWIQKSPNTPPPPPNKKEISVINFFVSNFFQELKFSLGGWRLLLELRNAWYPILSVYFHFTILLHKNLI